MTAANDTDFVRLAAAVLQERCADNRNIDDGQRTQLTLFHSSRMPTITMPDYFKRIGKYSACSPECHIIAIIYISRYTTAMNVPLTFRNSHRLVIVAVMLAAKNRDDIYFSNGYYASIGGVSNKEINELESEFLAAIDWATWVSFEEFNNYVESLYQKFGALVGAPPSSGALLGAQ
jgi:hypothetical protein